MKHKPKKNPNYRYRHLDDDEKISIDKKTSHRRERHEFNPHRIKAVWQSMEDRDAQIRTDNEKRRMMKKSADVRSKVIDPLDPLDYVEDGG